MYDREEITRTQEKKQRAGEASKNRKLKLRIAKLEKNREDEGGKNYNCKNSNKGQISRRGMMCKSQVVNEKKEER